MVLKDDKKVHIIKLRYIYNLALERIAEQFNISRAAVNQMLIHCNRLIKRNAGISGWPLKQAYGMQISPLVRIG